jgi:two-component system, NtrC family, sensor kinase
MKIVHKIISASISQVILMAMIFFFSYQNLNLVLAKLRFVELADDLNASFLEMRLAEKNYFLYNDESALSEIATKLKDSMGAIDAVSTDIIRAIGAKNYDLLKLRSQRYMNVIEDAKSGPPGDKTLEATVRDAGRNLREFSSDITHLERQEVNRIISKSTNVLFYSFCAILVLAIGVSHLILFDIRKSLKRIEQVAHSISEGDFDNVEADISGDELGSVMKAINSMSEELKNREEIITQSKKLESLGILTAGVAHELGNPLNNIAMIAQTYAEVYDTLSREDRIEYMKKVEEETDRIKEIVKNLLDFSRPKKPVLKEAEINSVIKKTLKFVQNMLHVCCIDIRLALQEGLPHVCIDEPEIQEVFVNLITNAVHAMSPRCELSITTRLGDDEKYVAIDVEDTGRGIPPEVLPYIFDPFFSTKGVEGTGLGLSVSYSIIKNHKGKIQVRSEVGVGTTFTIELPVYKGKEGQDEWSQNHGN